MLSIIQRNYFVISNLNNERLVRQSGSFLICGKYNVQLKEKIGQSIVKRAYSDVQDEFELQSFRIPAGRKDAILEELSFYNINEGTLFPELEHQMAYIKSNYANTQKPMVDRFVKTEVPIASIKEVRNLDVSDDKVDEIIREALHNAVHPEIFDDCYVAIQKNLMPDWYRKEIGLSKVRLALTETLDNGTPMGRAVAKRAAHSIVTKIVNAIEQESNGRKANGIIFTTMFKFERGEKPLSERRNVVVMADEAHRGQYGFDEKIVIKENEQGEKEAHTVIGNARIIHDALPNATYIGFTGTPISAKDRNTREVFGDYIDIYDMTQAVEDGATRPVYYESRVIKLHLDQNTLALIDATYDALEQQSDAATIEKSKKMLGQMESVLGAESTIQSLCEDIVNHYEKYRANLLTGKAMIVAYSRPIAMKIYRKLLELRPTWNEKIGVVMTGGNNDPEDWKEIIGTKSHKEELARKFKDNDDPMKIAIVVDMWLTGFDVPSLATMYVYKPMHGYNLMQAIARVNRVFKDKEGGLIVDYVGIASALKAAMKEYTKRDQSRYGDMDIAKVAYPKFQEKLQVCKDLLHGFDFSGFIGGSPLMMAKLVTGGVNFVLDAKAPKRKDLFLREALLLKQSHSLCSSMTTEQERHEAAYMEAVRSTVVKITYGGSGGKTLSLKEINAQINELLKASIQSQGVISLFDSKQADENISLFDPAVLDEISKMKEKNIAVEILKKLMAEQVSLYKRTNVVQSQKFSEKITQLMNSYYNGLITNEEVIKELLKTAQEITELYNNGKKLGLTQEELAFYDALTKPENIKDFYQNNELIDLTRELTEMLRKNRTIDWQKKETARASMRKMVKHLLKKYKYPPEDCDTAISTVISQCEMWTDNMIV